MSRVGPEIVTHYIQSIFIPDDQSEALPETLNIVIYFVCGSEQFFGNVLITMAQLPGLIGKEMYYDPQYPEDGFLIDNEGADEEIVSDEQAPDQTLPPHIADNGTVDDAQNEVDSDDSDEENWLDYE